MARRRKFHPNMKPVSPSKPQKMLSGRSSLGTVTLGSYGTVDITDEIRGWCNKAEFIEMSDIDYYSDYYDTERSVHTVEVSFYTNSETENPNYAQQMEFYKEAYAEYKEELAWWKDEKVKWDAKQVGVNKKRDMANKKRLERQLADLKKKYKDDDDVDWSS